MLNGEPIAEPLVRFAAGSTFLLIMIIAGVLMVLLFLGVGMFLLAMFVGLMGVFIMAPYFWPVPAIILLVITLMTVGNGSKD